MKKEVLPLEEVSINGLFNSSEKAIFEVPIYQRNYAWEKEEISALIQDVYDSFVKGLSVYYIGTLVLYHRGDQVYEIIDGQQRLTTIRLILGVLDVTPRNRLTYRARKKSDDTISSIPKFDKEELDLGITNGFKYAKSAVEDYVSEVERGRFTAYFLNKVHIIHYRVPKDIDLNHYFEIMNSRGEQLEKHEIIKARLLSKLADPNDRMVFNSIWESCSTMGVYIQQTLPSPLTVFGSTLCEFLPDSFEKIQLSGIGVHENKKTIEALLSADNEADAAETQEQAERPDSFQPIIDFSNFLLTVLKLTRVSEQSFSPQDFLLDDKELINEFDKVKTDESFVKRFGFNLLKAKFLLDIQLLCSELPKNKNILSVFAVPVDQYTAIQKPIAQAVVRIGGKGTIHGCIVDIDFYNHIYVDPFDLTITPYYATDIVNKIIYPTIPSLLESACPKLYGNYMHLLNGEQSKSLAILETTSQEKPQINLDTRMYRASRVIKKMQKLNSHILSVWYEDPLPDQILLDPQALEEVNTDYDALALRRP